MQWEYCTVVYGADRGKIRKILFNGQELSEQRGKSWAEYLNKLGKEGWEMTGTTDLLGASTLYFKRPIQN